MSIQFKRGTTAQHATYTGAIGELTFDTDKKVAVLHDGVTAGGWPMGNSEILSIAGSVAANALTAKLNPCRLYFRASPLPTGTTNNRTVPSAISLVVPSTATLGTVSAQSARLVLLAIDNAGAVELAITNISGGLNLDETTLISTTAISAAATAANVIYSTTSRTSVPFRVVGFVDITEATAGTWATAPTTVQGVGGQALAATSSLGYGQKLQAVTRAIATTYYNTLGKPREVFFNLASAATVCGATLIVAGVVADQYSTAAANAEVVNLSAIIGPGESYIVTVTSMVITSASERF